MKNEINIKKIIILFLIAVAIIYVGFSFVCKNNDKNANKNENKIIGVWTTSYELGSYGKVSQTYNININNTCSKILVTDMEIKQECKYEIKDDQIIFKYANESKKYKFRFEENKLILGGYAYEKK